MKRAYWDDEVSVLSAENVFFDIETAGLGARFGATLIDFTLQLLAALVLGVAGAFIESNLLPFESMTLWMIEAIRAIAMLVGFIIFFGYYFIFEWLWDGQTPGKRLLKLRVMQVDGMPITYWHALVRNILRIVDFIPPPYGVGAIVALINDNNRRIGDLVAGTVVARERGDINKERPLDIRVAIENFLGAGPGRPESIPVPADSLNNAAGEAGQQAPVSLVATEEVDETTAILLARLDAQDYELLRDFSVRAASLPEQARTRLARSLATRLAIKLKIEAPPESEAEGFLLEASRRLQGRM